MKYILHYGYYECDGFEVFNSRASADSFIDANLAFYDIKGNKDGFFFELYECSDLKKLVTNIKD